MAKSINRLLAELIDDDGDVQAQYLDNADGGGLVYYETLDSLPVGNVLEKGNLAYVAANQRMYVSNGVGWYNAGLANRSPRWDSGGEPDAEYDIADSATPLVIIARAVDSDNSNINLLNQATATDSAQYMVSITNDSSVFTFTPKSADSIGIEVAAGNLTDSNGDFTYTFKWSDGISFVSKAVTIGYSPAGGSGGIFGTRGILFNASSTGPSGNGYNNSNVIEYFDISGSTGITATDFGDLLEQSGDTPGSAVTNAVRGVYQVYHGGVNPERHLQYVTISTPGNAVSFGQHVRNMSGYASHQDGTYGYFARNGGSSSNDLGVITVDTEANATQTGYTLNTSFLHYNAAGCGDTTRMLVAAGETNSGNTDVIQYITMPVASNASSFGSLSFARRNTDGTSDATYSVWGGAWVNGSISDMDYVTTQTTGNSSNFGYLSVTRNDAGACTDGSRGCWIGGYQGSSYTRQSTIDYVTLSTPGNAASFGNMTSGGNHAQATSGNAA